MHVENYLIVDFSTCDDKDYFVSIHFWLSTLFFSLYLLQGNAWLELSVEREKPYILTNNSFPPLFIHVYFAYK